MLKPFFNKKGHLGKTTDEVKEAINAAGSIPAIESGDAGKAIVVNEEEDGFELATVGGGGGGSDLFPISPDTTYTLSDAEYTGLSGSTAVAYTITIPKEKLNPAAGMVPAYITLRNEAGEFYILHLVRVDSIKFGYYMAVIWFGSTGKAIYLTVDTETTPGTLQCGLFARLV